MEAPRKPCPSDVSDDEWAFFAEFVALLLPDLYSYLDVNHLTFLDKEIFTDVTEGEEYVADLIVRTRFRTPGAAGASSDAFFLVHVENQSHPQAEFGRRMFRYWARLYEKHGLPVYPVVLFSYDTPLRAEPDRFTVDFPDRTVLDFHYRVIQLNRLSWRDYVTQTNPVASALMAKMKVAPDERWRVKLECLRLLATLRLDRARMRLISGFVDTYLQLGREERQLFETALTAEGLQKKEQVMEIVTSWMQEGIEIGLQRGITQGLTQGLTQGVAQGLTQGLTQGVAQGMEAIVLRQLQKRVGGLSPAAEAAVRVLQPNGLEALADDLLDFSTPHDLDRWLTVHRA